MPRRKMKWSPLILLILSPFAYPLCSHLHRTSFSQQVVVPDKPIFDVNLSLCNAVLSANGSCCTEELETAMFDAMKQELAAVFQDRIIALKQSLHYHYELFDKQYREAIDTSSKQLHAMFTRTYGPFYQSHTQIFAKFFDDLQQFYSGPRYIPLKPILDRFFFDLFRTLLLILNPTDEIREDKIDCLKSSLVLQPFGDIPLKMVRQLERSLGAAKSLTDALKSSSDILQDILQRELSANCQRAVTRMKHCAQCFPASERMFVGKSVKPCQTYCFNILNQCFADYIIIENTWKQFIEALTKLATRLRGPYNVMAVVIPLAVQISESIMVFQEKAPTLSAKYLRKCLRKDKEGSLKRDFTPFKTSSEPLPDFSDSLTNAQSQLLTSFIGKIKEFEGFWKIGPRLTCINGSWSATAVDDTCWNGTEIVDNLEAMNEFSDGGIGSNFTTSVFLNERLKLLMLSNRLLESYEGRRIYNESTDMEEEEASGNGGSYAPIDDEDGDYGSGSDEDQSAVVVDVAGSHRDITETSVTEQSDLQNKSSTTTSKPSITTLPRPDVEITKASTYQTSLCYALYLINIFRIL